MWECINIEQKNTILQVAKFSDFYGQVKQVQVISQMQDVWMTQNNWKILVTK